MDFTSTFADLVRRRRSCRKFVETPLALEVRRQFEAFLAAEYRGPFGGSARFSLIAATTEDHAALRGLGTYGFISGVKGFVVGAIGRGPGDLEDFGYLMERVILRATDLGLGSCWLGGTFSRSSFARRAALAVNEVMPAVTAVGYAVDGGFAKDRIRTLAGSNFRLSPEALFFNGGFGSPLSPADAGEYAGPLEMVRWAPSASNRQPWRIVRTRTGWHFYLARSRHYGKGTLLFAVLRMADLQRVDMGIAMCHFELVARETGQAGSWVVENPGIATPKAGMEYTATWRPASGR